MSDKQVSEWGAGGALSETMAKVLVHNLDRGGFRWKAVNSFRLVSLSPVLSALHGTLPFALPALICRATDVLWLRRRRSHKQVQRRGNRGTPKGGEGGKRGGTGEGWKKKRGK